MSEPLNFDYARSSHFITRNKEKLRVILVGTGGTGSWLAQYIAISVKVFLERGGEAHVIFVDPDTVEAKNVGRQNFCAAEIGLPKATTLARRYSAAYGLAIEAVPEAFSERSISHAYNATTLLIGAVDNAAARIELNNCLSKNYHTSFIWLDCGNSGEGKLVGNVMLGTTSDKKALAEQEKHIAKGLCTHLPSPALQDPRLLIARPEENSDVPLSCADIIARNEQALTINRSVAALASQYINSLILGHPIRQMRTTIDLGSLSCKSHYITWDNISKYAVES